MPLLLYTLLRLAMFAAVYLLLAFVGFRGWLLIIGALIIAALLSYLVLPRQANAAAGVLEDKVGDREGRIDRSIAVDEDIEDALLDESPRQADGETRPGAPGAGEGPRDGSDGSVR